MGSRRLRGLLRVGLLGSHLSFPFILGFALQGVTTATRQDRQLPRVEEKLKRIVGVIPKMAKDTQKAGRNPRPSADVELRCPGDGAGRRRS